MIPREEIDSKALEFGIHQSNVQRDYVFGWLLYGIYSATNLSDSLILKGGNCFRKAYFPTTRFSKDLDFSTERRVDPEATRIEFNRACHFVQDNAGVEFDLQRSRVELQGELSKDRQVFDVRLYFKNFYGEADHIIISLSIDITEFAKIFLPVEERRIIHPYSDAYRVADPIRCLKLEEMLASKLKCLLQRRHTADLYDLVYSIFVNKELAVDSAQVISTFLRKTIYERSPGSAKQLLLDLPLIGLRAAWERYIVAPIGGVLDFDEVLQQFREAIELLFAGQPFGDRAALTFFPSQLRTPIIAAGADFKLLRIVYDGVPRIVEPYALSYKRRQDGHAEEYLYVYDRTGGRSTGPGLKSWLNRKIGAVETLDEKFEPRYPVELAKAGELSDKTYFGGRLGSQRSSSLSAFRTLRHGWRYTVQCSYCARRFKRMARSTRLKSHKDAYGNPCFGRAGVIVDQELV